VHCAHVSDFRLWMTLRHVCAIISSGRARRTTTSRATRLCLASALAIAGVVSSTAAQAAPSAATICPPFNFITAINHADNPSFETVGSNGNPSICAAPCVAPQESAADQWTIHSDNFGAAVSTRLEPLSVLDPRREPFGTDPKAQKRMLHIIAGGGEGGVYQRHRTSPARLMFQVWVYVHSGHVVVQANGGNLGPAAWSTKKDQWEELRVCTDGTVPTDVLVVYNEDPAGGDFFIDRAEAREIP
jgi:hypothetical protein